MSAPKPAASWEEIDRRRAAAQRKQAALARVGQPEPGIYKQSWQPPASWGEPVTLPGRDDGRRERSPELGLPYEVRTYLVDDRPVTVRRFLVPVHRFD